MPNTSTHTHTPTPYHSCNKIHENHKCKDRRNAKKSLFLSPIKQGLTATLAPPTKKRFWPKGSMEPHQERPQQGLYNKIWKPVQLSLDIYYAQKIWSLTGCSWTLLDWWPSKKRGVILCKNYIDHPWSKANKLGGINLLCFLPLSSLPFSLRVTYPYLTPHYVKSQAVL